MIVAVVSVALVVVVSASRLDPCEDSRLAETPLCDMDLSFDQRAEGFVRLLSLKEKVQQMNNMAPGIDRLGLPPYQWWNEALHGVLHDCINGRCPTSYPAPLALAATFNMDLVEKVAEQISTEARAIHTFSDGQYGLQVWTPNINIYKDPRWGRGQETPGECVYLTSQYAIRYIRGLQGANNSESYPKLFATVKHFAVYNEETKRNQFDAIVSDIDLHQTFLPAFEFSIVEGRAGSVMCSYNSVNGVPACANQYLLKTNLRDAWKFDGFVVSDCDAIDDISRNHHFVNTSVQGSAAALRSGVDLDCGSSYLLLEDAVNRALIEEELVDKALQRLLVGRLRLGQFDPAKSQPFNQISLEAVDSNQHRLTALQAARESLVLLKNEGSFLPLRADDISSALITGPHASTTSDLCSNYIGQLPKVVSVGQGIKDALPSADVTIREGCGMTEINLSEALSALKEAKSHQYTIVALGLDQTQETETKDRKHIDLPGHQLEFLKEVAKKTSNIILIIIGGGSVDLTWAKSSPAVKAIIYGFYPGEETGNATADLILGKYSPSGRLPITLYERSYIDQVDIASMEMAKEPGKTYRFYNGLPVYPFGFGLTYTQFSLKWLSTPSDGHFKVSIQNIGSTTSDFSLLAYFNLNDQQCPKRQLFAIQKLANIEPAETRSVQFIYDLKQAYCVNEKGSRIITKEPIIITIENLSANIKIDIDQKSETNSQIDVTSVAILPFDAKSETF